MMNDIYYLVLILLSLSSVLIAFRLGKDYLIATFSALYIVCNLTAPKVVSVFGFDTTVASVFYASLFLVTDLCSEHYGKQTASKCVKIGFFVLIAYFVLTQLTKFVLPVEFSATFHESLSNIFGSVTRITLASLLAYIIANNFDVWWYHKIKNKFSSKKYLWLRNNGSTIVSQFVDSIVFFPIAFWGVLPNNIFYSVFISGYIIKVLVALIDTPFLYLSYRIKPKDAVQV